MRILTILLGLGIFALNLAQASNLHVQKNSCAIELLLGSLWDIEREDKAAFRQILDIWTSRRTRIPKDIEQMIRNIICHGNCRVFTYKNGDEIVGFAATRLDRQPELLRDTPYADDTSYYFALAATKPGWENLGIYSSLAKERIRSITTSTFSDIFHLRTQNPKIHTATVKALEELKREGAIKGYKLVVKKVMKKFYDGQQLIKEEQVSSDPETQKLFSEINIKDGDAYVFAWQLEK